MADLLQSQWFVWGIGLILGFQILVVVMGELVYRADRQSWAVAPIVRAARNAVLPLLVIYLFVVKILEEPADSIAVRAIATGLWISLLYTGLLLVNVLVFEQAPENTWRHRAPSLFQDLLRMLLVAVGAAIVLALVWDQNLGGLIAALGVGSIVLGLALQETLGNLMAGIALLFERPFTIGDWIEVAGEQGEVVQINWRSVHVRTRERNLLVFPNSVLGREAIINYARPTPMQSLRLSFAFSLEDPPNAVREVMEGAARGMDAVLDEPAPAALLREVLDDRVRYEAFIFIADQTQIPQIVDEYSTRVWYAARRAGIRLPLPTAYEIKVDAPLAADREVDMIACLAAAPGFELLDAQAINRLAEQSVMVVYGDGETIIGEHDVADAAYVIEAGVARVIWTPEDGSIAHLDLGPGNVLGVTSLVRQQSSHLAVRCIGDVTTIRVPRNLVDACIRDDVALAHAFTLLHERRTEALERARDQDDAEIGDEPTVLPINMRRPQANPNEEEAGEA